MVLTLVNVQYDMRCRFDHRCAFCGKFGHGAQVCRRAAGALDRADRHDRHDRYDPESGERSYDRYHVDHRRDNRGHGKWKPLCR